MTCVVFARTAAREQARYTVVKKLRKNIYTYLQRCYKICIATKFVRQIAEKIKIIGQTISRDCCMNVCSSLYLHIYLLFLILYINFFVLLNSTIRFVYNRLKFLLEVTLIAELSKKFQKFKQQWRIWNEFESSRGYRRQTKFIH